MLPVRIPGKALKRARARRISGVRSFSRLTRTGCRLASSLGRSRCFYVVYCLLATALVRYVLSDIDNASTTAQAEREALYYRMQPTKVNPFPYGIRLAPGGVCRNDTRMIIVVHSHPSYADRRAAIRKTWGDAVRRRRWPTDAETSGKASACCDGTQLVFSIGLHRNPNVNRQVENEFRVQRDIVQGNFIDDYRNMTLKSLFDLKFVAERCPDIRYLLKADDDAFINLPYLYDVIRLNEPMRHSIMGPFNPRSPVERVGVWALSFDEFPFSVFPPYESGSAYVITGDLVAELFQTSEYVPSIFIDDVYVTGILGWILGVQHLKHTGFAYWGDDPLTACEILKRRVITGTRLSPLKLRLLWRQLESEELQC